MRKILFKGAAVVAGLCMLSYITSFAFDLLNAASDLAVAVGVILLIAEVMGVVSAAGFLYLSSKESSNA
jgi:hypothetical protein